MTGSSSVPIKLFVIIRVATDYIKVCNQLHKSVQPWSAPTSAGRDRMFL